jgi:hypothetical protein
MLGMELGIFPRFKGLVDVRASPHDDFAGLRALANPALFRLESSGEKPSATAVNIRTRANLWEVISPPAVN